MKQQSERKLALFGGPKAIEGSFKRYNSIGREEALAAGRVIESGVLSQFLGCWDEDFYGGAKVREFESAWKDYFGVEHAVSVNSATSGLIAAVGAVDIEPGDEVIVSPWTMCATATSILMWNAIPVFADIEPETFNLDPASVRERITPRTKAIIVTDIFGHAARLDEIMAIAREHGLKVIEDAAQAPGARYGDRFVGTVADIGVFSLNYHKHIHTGEGGMCVTRDDDLAERLQLIRNHAEAVVQGKGVANLSNMIGYNFRLGEIEAAIGLEQLKKLDGLLRSVAGRASRLTSGLKDLPGLRTPLVMDGCTHVYYVYPMIYDASVTGVSRERLLEALRAEGLRIGGGYQNLHLLPLFQQKTAYGTQGFPWNVFDPEGKVSYAKGICPVAETLQDGAFMVLPMCLFELDDADVDAVVGTFTKVWANLDQLAGMQPMDRSGETR